MKINVFQLDKLRKQISEWSRENFGENMTDMLPTYSVSENNVATRVPMVTVALESIAPLMGIGEEIGETFAAMSTVRTTYLYEVRQAAEFEVIDGLGDVGIYLCDYIAREKITFQFCFQDDPTRLEIPPYDFQRLPAVYGRLLHIHLKRFQRIRNCDDIDYFRAAQSKIVVDLVGALYSEAQNRGKRYDDIITDVWNKIVAKRNWNVNKKDGTAG